MTDPTPADQAGHTTAGQNQAGQHQAGSDTPPVLRLVPANGSQPATAPADRTGRQDDNQPRHSQPQTDRELVDQEQADADQADADQADEELVDACDGAVSPLAQMLARARAVAAWAHPPNLRTEVPPTWDQIGWHGRHGQHVAAEGWTRKATVVWNFAVYRPFRVLWVYADWLLRSPSRFVTAVVLYGLAAHVRALAWLPWPLPF